MMSSAFIISKKISRLLLSERGIKNHGDHHEIITIIHNLVSQDLGYNFSEVLHVNKLEQELWQGKELF